MKKILLLVLLCIVLFKSCIQKAPKGKSVTAEIFEGKHLLRKLNKTVTTKSDHSGSYFLIFGQVNATTYKDINITFSWELNDGDYIISEMPIKDVRIRIDSTVTNPYVLFNWNSSYNPIVSRNDINALMRHYINYVVIVCNEEDYPKDINIGKI